MNFAYALYSDLLGRAPQSAEVTDTVRVANEASARLELAERLLQSTEGRAQLAQMTALQYANRTATQQELVAAISALEVRENDIIARTFNLQTETFAAHISVHLRDVEVLPLAGNTFPMVIVGGARDEAGFAVQTTLLVDGGMYPH